MALGAWPVALEMSVTAAAPRETIWHLITDWERQGDWMLEARDFVVLSSHREGVGVEAEATVVVAGIKTRDVVRVVGWEPPKRLVIRHEGWVSGEGQLHLTPLHDGSTHIFWREELHPPLGALGAAGLTLLKPVMYRLFRRDLRILAALGRVAAGSEAGVSDGAEKSATDG